MTAALEGGEWSAARPGQSLPQRKTRYPFCRRLGGPQGRSGGTENLVPTGIRSRAVQPVVSRYTEGATQPTILRALCDKYNNLCRISRHHICPFSGHPYGLRTSIIGNFELLYFNISLPMRNQINIYIYIYIYIYICYFSRLIATNFAILI